MKKLSLFIISCLFIGMSNYSFGQGLADLNIRWGKEIEHDGVIISIIPQPNGTYLAVGRVFTSTPSDPTVRFRGYVINIDEDGNKVNDNEYILSPPASSEAWANLGAISEIHYAHLTDDGGIITFGTVKNADPAINHLKGHDLGGTGINNAPWLKDGLWVSKVDVATKTVAWEKLDRCNSEVTGSRRTADGNFLVLGIDSQGATAIDVFMFRIYDKDGNWIYDNYTNATSAGFAHGYGGYTLAWCDILGVAANGNYTLATKTHVYEVNPTNYTIDLSTPKATALLQSDAGNGCMETVVGDIWNTHPRFSAKSDGGYWVTSRMGSVEQGAGTGIVDDYGFSAYKIKNNILENCKIIKHANEKATKQYHAPLQLPGIHNKNKYVSTLIEHNLVKVALFEDAPGGLFQITDAESLVHNTMIKCTSLKEGFLTGGISLGGKIALGKYSLCSIELTNVEDEYYPYSSFSTNIDFKRDIKFNKSKEDRIKYDLVVTVEKGEVNNIPKGGILFSATDLEPEDLGAKILCKINQSYKVSSTDKHAEIKYTFTLRDTYSDGGIDRVCETEYPLKLVISSPTSTLFSDDIWFFGLNVGAPTIPTTTNIGTPFTSKGLIFKKDENGKVKVNTAAGISKVNTWENSLSVSTPSCDGDFIFYTQHDSIFTSEHKKMKNGYIQGHSSCGAGQVAAYIGDNKYILFSISNINRGGDLSYYIIDMTKDGGLGENLGGTLIQGPNKKNECLVLIPKVGTFDKYWLIYTDYSPNPSIVGDETINVLEIDGAKSNPIGNVVCSIPCPSKNLAVFQMRHNKTYTKIVSTTSGNAGSILTSLSFDPLTGQLKLKESFNMPYLYGIEFSPNGQFLYIADRYGNPNNSNLHQFEFNVDGTINKASKQSQVYASAPVGATGGGGLKIGPDGKMYIARESVPTMGFINNPNVKFGTPGSEINDLVFDSKFVGRGLGISTGLTQPWIDPKVTNNPPQANLDIASTFEGMDITGLKPLDNDFDQDGDQLIVSGNKIINIPLSDTTKIKVKYDSITKEASFSFNNNYMPKTDTVMTFSYIARDLGAPVQRCDEGFIKIQIRKVRDLILKDSCSFAPILVADAQEQTIIWEKAEVNTPTVTDWSVITGENTYKLDLTNLDSSKTYNYRYRVKGTNNKESYNSKPIKFTLEKYKIADRTWYKIIEK